MTGVGAKAPPAPVPFPACQIPDPPLPTFGRLLAAEGVLWCTPQEVLFRASKSY
jgi:hypothetical protein